MNQYEFSNENTGPELGSESKMPVRSYNDLQLFFLMRLARLLRQKREYTVSEKGNTPEEWRLRLFNKTIYSTFRDCVDQGVGEDARLLFQQEASTSTFQA